jgi:CubicO group peptidase (beta-lactamase class C family)
VSARFLLVLLFLSIPSASFAQAAEADTRAWTIPSNDEIRKLLAERMAHNGVGIVVGVIEPVGKRVVVHGRSGAADGRPLDGDTVFQVGSVTKVFTGLLLAEMAVRGEVHLEDPAAKYLPPGVTMPERGRPITLIDLSKHWSALPSMPTNFSLRAEPNPYEAYSALQLFEFLSHYESPREPGTQQYSNLGVALLGRLLAYRANMDYEQLLRERVLAPLQLKSTSITVTADQRSRLAPGHDRFLQPVDTWNLLAMPASGSLRSTANDLLHFLEFHLGIRETPLHTAMGLQRTPKRALGWGASTLGGDTVYGHEGGKEGYRSAVVFNPRTKTGVVVLTNARTDDSPMQLARHLLFGSNALPPATAAPVRPTLAKLDRATLDALSGEYQTESDDRNTVVRKGDHLLVDARGSGIGTYFPSSDRAFFANTDDGEILFLRYDNAPASGLIFCSEGTAQNAMRVGDVP